jgi:S-formylglutathione hydrolase FrmB
MKKSIIILTVFLIGISSSAQLGTVNDQYTLDSKIMGRTMKYSVYLPEGYDTSTRSYPVIYLLHGYGGNQSSWIEDGEVNRIVSREITNMNAPEMIIVMPDGGNYFYINTLGDTVRYEDYFIKEFIPNVEKQFRIMSRTNKRAIAGLSMGGYGALYHVLTHRELFGACYAMSAATGVIDRRGEDERDVDSEYYDSHNIVKLIQNAEYDPQDPDWRKRFFPMVFLDCGDDDFLTMANNEVYEAFREKQIPVEYRIHDGGHSWAYWRRALPDALEYIGTMFRR